MTNTASAALVAALGELTNPVKDRTANAGQYSYKYADLATVIDHVRPVLARHELAVTQNVTVDESKLEVWTYIHHSSGDVVTFGPLVGRAGGDWQALGSAITYARRYALGAALGIAPEDDNDNNGPLRVSPEPVKAKEPQRVSHSDQVIPDFDPWQTPLVDPETGEEATAPNRAAESLVEAMLGATVINGVVHDETHPLRTSVMHDRAPSEKSLTWCQRLVRKGAVELGIDELAYLNANLADLAFPEVVSWESLGQKACSKVIDRLKVSA